MAGMAGALVSVLIAAPASAATIPASSGSRNDVQAAVDIAAAGDVVAIPAGDFAFSGTVTIGKRVELRGAGATSTKLRSQNGSGVTMVLVTTDGVRISGLTFSGRPQGTATQDYGIKLNGSIDFGIVDCVFENFGWAAIYVTGADARGVVSRCDFIDNFRPEINNLGYGVVVYGDGATNWERPVVYGSEDFVFVEDCFFTGNRHAVASNNGARYVFRHNVSVDPRPSNLQHVDAHGLEYGSSRGTRAFEVYGNKLSNSGDPTWAGIYIRGGDGVIFDNVMGPGIGRGVLLSNRADGSSDCNYPNQDQTTDLYAWNNLDDGQPSYVSVRSGHECLFAEGTDYFNAKRPGYVPFTYPHPLVGGSGVKAPKPPKLLRVVD